MSRRSILFFFQAEDGIRDVAVTGVQTCALPIFGQVVTGSRNDASFAVALNCGIGSRFFECTRERVGETPRCPRTEFLDLRIDRKSTRLNSSHGYISYAVFCLKKKKKNTYLSQIIYFIYPHFLHDIIYLL